MSSARNEGPSSLVVIWRRLITSPATPRIAVATACFLLVFGVTGNRLAHPRSSRLMVGEVSPTDLVARFATLYTDTQATKEAREAAARDVRPVYSIDTPSNDSITGNLDRFFLRLDELVGELKLVREMGAEPPDEQVEPPDDSTAGPEVPFRTPEETEDAAVGELQGMLDDSIQIQVNLVDPVSAESIRGLLNADAATRESLYDLLKDAIRTKIMNLIFEENLSQELNSLKGKIVGKAEEFGLSQENGRLAAQLLTYFMRSNAILDLDATERARQQARDATPPEQKEVRAGQIFLRAGEVVDQEDIDIMEALGMTSGATGPPSWVLTLLFALVLASAFVLGSIHLAGRTVPQLNDARYYLLFYSIVAVSYLSSFFLVQTFSSRSAGTPNEVLLSLASLPVVAAAVLFSHYFTRMLAVTVSGFLAVVVTLAAGDASVLIPALFTSLAASLIIKRDCPKPFMIRAIVFLPLIWAGTLLAGAYSTGMDLSVLESNPWYLLAGLAPAPAAMIFANYVLDAAFNIPTSSRLAEFDNQDHPLLRKLQLDAPGTWHHCMMTGLIAEAACQAVGGNSHLVRVACMYHDIGKLRRPEFFIENQRGGANVHDKYSPWLSKIIVESHVKDGIAMAKAHGLPQELVDMIPHHHGTSLIAYFFRKALAMSEDGFVNEYDYRYPGPKPQTLEAACINLADAAESATRTLEEPTPHRIESLVNRIYEERLLDGQYNECGLALNQLETIKDIIIERLIGAYHARIDYPEEEELRRQLQLKRAEAEKPSKTEPGPDNDG